MLTEARVESILTNFKSMDLELKLKAINQAQEMFAEAFTENMTPEEYAYMARVIETCYNLLRDALKSSEQIRISPPSLGTAPVAKVKKVKAVGDGGTSKRKKSEPIAFEQMAAMFKEFQAKAATEGTPQS